MYDAEGSFGEFFRLLLICKGKCDTIAVQGGVIMEKTATINVRVTPSVKTNAEMVLNQLGIPMSTAIEIYLRQIYMTGGLPFSVIVPEAPRALNAANLTDEQLDEKLARGIEDYQKGNVRRAEDVFTEFGEKNFK